MRTVILFGLLSRDTSATISFLILATLAALALDFVDFMKVIGG